MDESKYSGLEKPKKLHPIKRTNIVMQWCFCWLLPFFYKGLKREFNEDHMYGTSKNQQSVILGERLEKAWNKEIATKKNPSLLKAMMKVFWSELLLNGILVICFEGNRILQPLVVSRLLLYFEPGSNKLDRTNAYIYSGLLVILSFVNVLVVHNFMLRIMGTGMKMRVAACALIYRKALKLSKSALGETTVGQMVNLLSNDVGRFDFAAQHIHSLWTAPVETVIIMYLLYISVGVTGLVGTTFLLCFIPFQMYMAKMTSKYRLRTAIRTDERVRLMNEIITGVQVIKMYTWEKPFAKLVEHARSRELREIRHTTTIRALIMSCNLVLHRAAVFLCILTYVLTGNVVNATYVYTVTSFYGTLRNAVTMNFPQAITQFAETYISVSRIKKFLLYDEIQLQKDEDDEERQNVGIKLQGVSVKWQEMLQDNSLTDINFEVGSDDLVAVVGPVGGGKTTLLHAILKELPPTEGKIEINGKISYCSQEPWVFGGTVRQNILFGEIYDEKRYNTVIKACALERDFTLFPYGDKTHVGERGVTLSGGQRARINLARAVYKNADIYLLDDPLSAVDTHVGKQLFDECICDFLKEKCVVLITHQLQYLQGVNIIYLLENGRITASGNYKQLKSYGGEFTKLLAKETKKAEEETRRKSERIENEKEDKDKEDQVVDKESRAHGVIAWHVYKNFFKAGGNIFKTILLIIVFILSQVLGSGTDYFVTLWVNLIQWKTENNNTNVNATINEEMTDNDQWWLNSILDENNALPIYTALIVILMVMVVTRSIGFFRYCLSASSTLHNNMFNKIVFSPMKFFNTNPTGRILNRFSKDIGAIDENLPITLIDTVQIFLMVLGITLVIGTLNPWILIPSVVILVIFYFIREVFLASSRNIKRVEAITRSPIYTHLTASLQGLTTIRAFGAQDILTEEFDKHQDAYTSAYYLFLTANRTFGFWLDLHCVIYMALVTVSILFIENESFGGNVGLALTQSMTLMGMFQWGMRQWSELENQMTSVERVQEYADLEPELDQPSIKPPPKNWPEHGAVTFKDLSLRYSPDDPYVLKKLNFVVNPGEKVGIVGRTGAGKSSLIQALFRLAEIDGEIFIDGISTKSISLKELRSHISIIPQEPVLFSGTLRKNLDPFDQHDDDNLWKVLEDVELKHAVKDLPAGLDSKMAEGGSNFSVGQRQLVCLARAILRKNKILVLDEATANVDPQTDSLIQMTIRRKFDDCTVLTIAHRLNTVMDSDKVLVMDAGKAVEFDQPFILLRNEKGIFYGMVRQTGKAMAEELMAVAAKSFKGNLS